MTTPTAKQVEQCLKKQADPDKANYYPHFFKSGKGEYSEHDRFIGVTVPLQRKIARDFQLLSKVETGKLLDSPLHECRLTALLILVRQFERAKQLSERTAIYNFYFKKIGRVNNWDLVDASCYKILGAHLYHTEADREPLFKLARSRGLWKNRIAIISTLYFIKYGEHDTTIDIAEQLLLHEHDLIHKAVGWMLREIGKNDEQLMLAFIEKHYPRMPRTMLRYAIEKLPKQQRKRILSGVLPTVGNSP